ncbi:hypothetical protein MNBD_CHLOROFLEXI01-5278 [hydrothermal vent metagenome]|uniref:Uncharacterized protein n=1 Tax=hydrothermal vent metagenome TaxID=652676 RepID=A0A3B0UUV1_9ZZZZ
MNIKVVPVLLGIVILILLAGCSIETAYAPENEAAKTPTPAPTPTFTPNTAVIFKRSDSLTDLNEEWIIFTDGRIEANSGDTSQISAEKVSQLLNSLESAGFFDLDDSYLPEDSCCDRFLYEIMAVNNTTFHTVTTLEDTPDMPEALQQTLRLIQITLFDNNNE